MAIENIFLLENATAVAAGATHSPNFKSKTFQLSGSTTDGTGAAEVDVEISNSAIVGTWGKLGTITLVLGTTITSDSFPSDVAYAHYRGNVKSISGTGAKVTLSMRGV